jgi:hypothetical protein
MYHPLPAGLGAEPSRRARPLKTQNISILTHSIVRCNTSWSGQILT